MTFSVIARAGDSLGVAVASKFLAVGAVVPAARAGAGALATQAAANLRYRPDGLALLATGATAAETVARLISADPGAASRQVGVVDRQGGSASHTGHGCAAWAGGLHGPGYAIQGNLLAGPEVLDAMLGDWLGSGEPADSAGPGALAARLLGCLAAGEAAGGDRRGRQSAALLVVAPGAGYGGGSDVAVDLRVDDHPAPVGELGRLLEAHQRYFGHTDPAEFLPLSGALAGEVRTLLAAAGFTAGTGEPLDAPLRAWAGVANLEERCTVDGRIDPVCLQVLREAAGNR